jgi:DNA-binding beta-propeller fold protein YncE
MKIGRAGALIITAAAALGPAAGGGAAAASAAGNSPRASMIYVANSGSNTVSVLAPCTK